jgi:hypothetical protein
VNYKARTGAKPVASCDSPFGGPLAQQPRMALRKVTDQQPGPPPEIRIKGDSVTFALKMSGTPNGARLVIRCDSEGNVWVSIAESR